VLRLQTLVCGFESSNLKSLLQNPPCGSAGMIQSQATPKVVAAIGNPPCDSLGIVSDPAFEEQRVRFNKIDTSSQAWI